MLESAELTSGRLLDVPIAFDRRGIIAEFRFQQFDLWIGQAQVEDALAGRRPSRLTVANFGFGVAESDRVKVGAQSREAGNGAGI